MRTEKDGASLHRGESAAINCRDREDVVCNLVGVEFSQSFKMMHVPLAQMFLSANSNQTLQIAQTRPGRNRFLFTSVRKKIQLAGLKKNLKLCSLREATARLAFLL